ncbi:unnamed protein product [Polarella glacialis]|uniref:Uncharacterized protein n=1 Tax=Polarella glacialis TaxID=89957 RepID=A0A813DJF1_POLGL|nr:unnamed protein product [Polarella glacialis]
MSRGQAAEHACKHTPAFAEAAMSFTLPFKCHCFAVFDVDVAIPAIGYICQCGFCHFHSVVEVGQVCSGVSRVTYGSGKGGFILPAINQTLFTRAGYSRHALSESIICCHKVGSYSTNLLLAVRETWVVSGFRE